MNEWLHILTLALVMILPLAALRRRRLPGRSFALMALAWGAIFALITLGFAVMVGR